MGIFSRYCVCRRGKSSDVDLESEDAVEDSEVFEIMGLPDLVLYKILRLLHWETLKKCRFVCSRWEYLIRGTLFTHDKICCEYQKLESALVVKKSTYAKETCKSLLSLTEKPKLKFSTIRLKNSALPTLTVFHNWLLMQNLTSFPFKLKCVTRVEFDPSLLDYSNDDGLLHFWTSFFPLLDCFDNVSELIIQHQRPKLRSFPPAFFILGNEVSSRYSKLRTFHKRQLRKLKKLKVLVYNVDTAKVSEYVVLFKLVGRYCSNLVEFRVKINYARIWWIEFVRNQLYRLLGIILRNNAATLVKVQIGTENVYLGQRVRRRPEFGSEYERKNWMVQYSNFTTNVMFDKLVEEMETNNWKDFGLKLLQCLILNFPLPILPCPQIGSVLKPFLESLESLRTLDIQPVVGGDCLNGIGQSRAMPYINHILEDSRTSKFKGKIWCPVVISDAIFYCDEKGEVDWPMLQNMCHYSLVDLEFKNPSENDDRETRSMHWRNMSWEKTTFKKSLIASSLAQLTQLVIYQSNFTEPGKRRTEGFISICDSDMQMIIREGRSLQEITLNCKLNELTHFGYTGLSKTSIDILKIIGVTELKVSRKSLCGYSILDLKDLRCLILIGITGHHGLPRSKISLQMERDDFEFVVRYLRTNPFHVLNLRYDSSNPSNGFVNRQFVYERHPFERISTLVWT